MAMTVCKGCEGACRVAADQKSPRTKRGLCSVCDRQFRPITDRQLNKLYSLTGIRVDSDLVSLSYAQELISRGVQEVTFELTQEVARFQEK